MATTNNKLQDENALPYSLSEYLNDLQIDFTARYNALLEAYFINKDGLKVIAGNSNYAIGFHIDCDLLKHLSNKS